MKARFKRLVHNLPEKLATMLSRIRFLLEAQAQKTRMEEEVSIASEIQQKLLPPSEIKTSRFEIQSHLG
jgi:serine phosphatase RsbU (regulator of sigma subunit)